jgi:PAS domain S-box-containing protein
VAAETLADFRRLADDLPWFIWTHSPDGAVDWANRAWYAFARLPREIATNAEGWARIVHPDDMAGLLAALGEAIGSGTTLELELRMKPGDAGPEAYRWHLIRSTPRHTDGGAVLAYWLGSAMDVHEVRARNEEQARAFQIIAEGIPEILWTTRPDGVVDWYNGRWFEYTGQRAADADALGYATVQHPDDVERVRARWERSVTSGEPFEIDTRMRRHDGAYRWFLNRALALRDERGEIVRWCGTSVDIDDARRARARDQLYARMTEEMSAALSLDETLRALTRLVVPEFGDYVLVNLLSEDGEPHCVAAYHRDPARRYEIRKLIGGVYSRAGARAGTRLSLRTGKQVFYETAGEELWSSIRPEFVPVFRGLGLDSAIGVPLLYRGRTVGTLSAVMAGSGRRFASTDLPLFEELARRIAPAVGNAEAYERERRVARSFQQAAMLQTLPRIPGLRFDAIYEAAHAEATVGGDWYDAVRLPDGRVMLSIGDVSGSGLDAAVTMGSVRQSIRTAALINPEPVMVLEAVDRIVRAMGDERFVTAFVALLDPVTFELRYAGAGHPPPALRAPDGSVALLGGGDLPLGLRQRETSRSAGVTVRPGSLLVAYTDGLIEYDRDPVAGERELIEAAGRARRAGAAHDVYRHIVGDRPARDDVAVLTVALDAPLTTAEGGIHTERWTFAADDERAAGAARREYARRLRGLGIAENEVVSAELIFGELVGNVYRYAPGEVEVILDASATAPVLHVFDGGEGFEYRPRLPSDLLSERGRGLFLVAALAEEVSAELRRPSGSHVRVVLAARPRMRALSTLARDALV